MLYGNAGAGKSHISIAAGVAAASLASGRRTYLTEHDGVVPWTWWSNKEIRHNQEATKESIALFGAAHVFVRQSQKD
ncbi:MAG: hypothetical protein LBU32_02950 [Clostridiales bacterium]|nr:hypothetical protein [Clostridiales bacterium]